MIVLDELRVGRQSEKRQIKEHNKEEQQQAQQRKKQIEAEKKKEKEMQRKRKNVPIVDQRYIESLKPEMFPK